jgi:predicted kinase
MNEDNKRAQFMREMQILHYAGVGVVLVRTKEENRVLAAIEDFSFEHGLPYRHWNTRDGWVTVENDKTKSDKNIDPIGAINAILDVETDEEQRKPMPEGVFVMLDVHHVLGKNPMLMRCVKEYSRVFSNNEYRLIIVVPEVFECPHSLSSEISIVDFDLPSRDELGESLDKVVRSSFVDDKGNPMKYEEPFDDDERALILNAAVGMTSMEAETAMARSIVQNEATWPKTSVDDFARVIMTTKTEVIKRSNVLELHRSLDPSKLGGMDLLKAWVEQRKRSFSAEARDFGVRPPKGIGLFGVPGTGKSLAAKIVPHILGRPLIRFDISRVFASLVGQTEEKIRGALKMIDAMSPCVVWVDEIDKAGLDQSGHSGDSGVSDRVLQALLTHMAESEKHTFWIFTANRVAKLPPEMLRKGRLEMLFNVAPPNRVERREILAIHLGLRNHDIDDLDDIDVVLDGSFGIRRRRDRSSGELCDHCRVQR